MRRTSRQSGGWARNLQDPVKRVLLECSVGYNWRQACARGRLYIYIIIACSLNGVGVVGQLLKILKTLDFNKRQVTSVWCREQKETDAESNLKSAWTLATSDDPFSPVTEIQKI